ncbi:MAG: DUF459 domain-containing protein [Neisseria sp.]|nr:DUF459 domain-containing protein [Neisseria sp.]
MQTSKSQGKTLAALYFALLCSAGVLTWFSQKSINAYWQQTYHQAGILEPLDQYGWWRKGAEAQEAANALYQDGLAWFAGQGAVWEEYAASLMPSEKTVEQPAPALADTPASALVPNTVAASEAASDTAASATASIATASEAVVQTASAPESAASVPSAMPSENPQQIVLRSGDKVFFAGDSLMQGVAPFAQKHLSSSYGIASLNLSKQSTGLSYPSFFDWPATIEKNVKADAAIKLLVVFLGPNDPWDFPNPQNKRQILKFKSPEWEAEYRSRVNRIVESANAAGVKIIWLGVPYMKGRKLNEQMRYLDGVLADELKGKVLWLPTAELLSGGTGRYQDTAPYQGKNERMRSKDGIHFTPKGQKRLADYIAEHIRYEP